MLIEDEFKSKFIPELIIEYLNKCGIYLIKNLPTKQECTLNDVIQYCKEIGIKNERADIDFNKLIKEAISIGYDKRYCRDDKLENERNVNQYQFTNSFWGILKDLNIEKSYKNKKIIIVGIGDGSEGKFLYRKVKNLVITDIAPNSLCRARQILPHAKVYQEEASNLKSMVNNSFDLYVSLRTYQSTYFDISKSLQEAKRILKNNGAIIISVACGYINKRNEFIYGLFDPHNGNFEINRPDFFLQIIRNNLEKLSFKIIGIKKIISEIFIYAIKLS